MLAAVGLNPLLTGPVIYGMNDVLILLSIVIVILLLKKNHLLSAAIVLGLACALKQSAWFLLPFFVMYVTPRVSGESTVKEVLKLLAATAVTSIVIIVPFALWDLSEFLTDVFAYPAGSVAINYPIRGYTVGNLLVGVGLIESPLDKFPFWILQLFIGIPLLIFLMKYQWRRNGLGSMILSAGIFTFGLGLVSRYFQDNLVGYVAVLVSIGIILGYEELIDHNSTEHYESTSDLLVASLEEE